MNKIILFILILLSANHVVASDDSLRIEYCGYTNTQECNGFDRYTWDITHYQSGLVSEQNSFQWSFCMTSPPDTGLIHVSDTYFQYDSAQRLFVRDYFDYLYGLGERLDTFSYDSVGNQISQSSYDGTTGNLIHTLQLYYNYDSLNRKTGYLNLVWNQTSSTWDSVYIFNWIYTGDSTIYIRRGLNSQTQTIDTNYVEIIVVDSLGRKTAIDEKYFNPPQDNIQYFSYDSLSHLVYMESIFVYNGFADSTRYYYTYTATNKPQQVIEQKFDTAAMQWISSYREYYSYNGFDSVSTYVWFNCPDSTCSDTAHLKIYVYDTANRLIAINDSMFDWDSGLWKTFQSSTTVYNTLGLITDGSDNDPPGHCSAHRNFHNDFNSLNQLIFHHDYTGTCDQSYSDCWFYSLTGDSMYVNLYYPRSACEGDTIQPGVLVYGGVQPVTAQWTPANLTLNPSNISSALIVDSATNYVLFITDSNGVTQSDDLYINVNCINTGIMQLSSSDFLNIFPNPASNEIHVLLNMEEDIRSIEIINLYGEKVFEQRVNKSATEFQLSVSDIPEGYYLLKVIGSKSYFVSRMMIQR